MPRRRFDPMQKYGRWTVIKPAPRSAKGNLRWQCRCDCGADSLVLQRTLLDGRSRSCGCLSVEVFVARTSKRRRTHGHTVGGYTPEYRAWLHMRNRCYNPNVKKFENHGGRGITVCDRWRDSFENFLADMGQRPSPKHSIDRIDNDGHYEPGNCRWAMPRVQQGNKSNNIRVEVEGESLALRHACDRYGVNYKLVHLRLRRGWPLDDAMARPIGNENGSGKQRPTSTKYSERELRLIFARACQTLKLMEARRAAA